MCKNHTSRAYIVVYITSDKKVRFPNAVSYVLEANQEFAVHYRKNALLFNLGKIKILMSSVHAGKRV